MKEKLYQLTSRFTTTQIILFGFALFIGVGAVLLMFPVSSATGDFTNPIDSLFTATTSVCVTGLVTVNTSTHWSVFGKVIILILIQAGGLGFMTCFTMVLLALGKRVTLRERMIIQDSLNESTLSGLVKFVKRIAKGTVMLEGIGAILYCFEFVPYYGWKGIPISIFTSISAFCNAGIDIFGEKANSMDLFVKSPIVNFVTMALIICGGLGYTVWWDITRIMRESRKNKLSIKGNIGRLSLHSKVTLTVTGVLIFGGAFLIFLLEHNNPNSMGNLNFFQKIMASFFQSVTTRTAGFLTIDQTHLKSPTQFLSILLMFIGGSPAGTAGGIKTSTFGVVVIFVLSIAKGKERAEAFHRTITYENCQKALAILSISIFVLICGALGLSVMEPDIDFMSLFFEVTSALATVGLSMDVTGHLHQYSKLLIIVLMYIGRIGPISLAIAFGMRQGKTTKGIKLPDDRVMVG